jgi:hypothetical protein
MRLPGFLTTLALLALALSFSVLSVPMIIPDKDKHSKFLLAPFKPGAPSVVVFKDPYCGYCIRALKKRDRMSEYNVYMFWAGILGDRSAKKVGEILNCAAPISGEVFDSVIKRESRVNCKAGLAEQTAQTRMLNDEMVANYQPNSVPAYYFGGRKVYVSQLDRFKSKLKMNITPIQLLWERYEALRVARKNHQGLANAIIFLSPNSVKRPYVIEALKKDTNYSWYLVETACSPGRECNETEKLSEELRLLLDVPQQKISITTTVVNGTVINPARYKQYFSTGLATLLSSK